MIFSAEIRQFQFDENPAWMAQAVGWFVADLHEIQLPRLSSAQLLDELQGEQRANYALTSASQPGTLLGVGSLHGPWENAPVGMILSRLVIHPDFRNQGLGSLLLANLEETTADQGVDGLWLTPNGERTQHFYERHGYREAYPDDDAMSLYVKQLS